MSVSVHKWGFDPRYYFVRVNDGGPNLHVVDDFGNLVRVTFGMEENYV